MHRRHHAKPEQRQAEAGLGKAPGHYKWSGLFFLLFSLPNIKREHRLLVVLIPRAKDAGRERALVG